jgi:hypothetical protein
MARAETLKPLDEHLSDKWNELAEGLANTETSLEAVKRKPVA